MDPKNLSLLIELINETGAAGEANLSLSLLSKRVGKSKQTVSRGLGKLEKRGLIERKTSPRGQTVRITPRGKAALRSLYRELGRILHMESRPIELVGFVIPGLGEGGYYMSQEGYVKQFEEKLGFKPYPGTLDLRLDEKSIEAKEMILQMPLNEIKGFKTRKREFGPVRFVAAEIGGKSAAVIFPARTHHSKIIEVVAPQNLRKTMGLRDGARVTVRVTI